MEVIAVDIGGVTMGVDGVAVATTPVVTTFDRWLACAVFTPCIIRSATELAVVSSVRLCAMTVALFWYFVLVTLVPSRCSVVVASMPCSTSRARGTR